MLRRVLLAKARLFHQEHLPGAFDGAVQSPLVMSGKTGVLPRKDAAGVGDKLFEQIDVFVVECVRGEVNLGLGARGADLHSAPAARTAARFVYVRLARHKNYLISRCSV